MKHFSEIKNFGEELHKHTQRLKEMGVLYQHTFYMILDYLKAKNPTLELDFEDKFNISEWVFNRKNEIETKAPEFDKISSKKNKRSDSQAP